MERFAMRVNSIFVVSAAALLFCGGCLEKEKTVPSNNPQPAETKPISAKPRVEMTTSKGKMVIELDPQKAPMTTANFLKYVESGYYNGLTFHRVIPGFMIQGGGFDSSMNQKRPNPPIVNEGQNGLKNDRGTIAMARTNDLNSATSQFFINVVNNGGLNYPSNGGYAVFGKVVEGMDVADAIAKVKTGVKMGMSDVPVEPVVIESAKVLAN
jgi:peptidyl-prolyl cis-trans isomerase A (cyclophilin A)